MQKEKMNKLIYFGVGFLILILIVGVFLKSNLTGKAIKNTNNSELEKYRFLNIPEECRLPEYENDIKAWKEHLNHHKNTWYCLEYYN